jgi:flagellar basal body rod protein FlgC
LAGDITGMNVALLRELQDGIEADRAYQRALAVLLFLAVDRCAGQLHT